MDQLNISDISADDFHVAKHSIPIGAEELSYAIKVCYDQIRAYARHSNIYDGVSYVQSLSPELRTSVLLYIRKLRVNSPKSNKRQGDKIIHS
jgi:hypothetical protein